MTPAEPLSPDEVAALNPGVRRLVAFLRSHGFNTCDSGDGETHQHGCDRDYAYVVCKVDPGRLCAEADRLAAVLREAGVKLASLTEDGAPRGHGVVEAHYASIDGLAFVEIMGVTDKGLPP